MSSPAGYRSQLIAWTETAQAYSYANEQALEATGVVSDYQRLATQDERVGPICGPLHGEPRKAGEQYTGGLKPAFAHIQCRCGEIGLGGCSVIREYRCERCKHMLFKGSLKLLLTKRQDGSTNYIESKCPKCGLINRYSHEPLTDIEKTDS